MADKNEFEFPVDDSKFVTEGRSSVKIKLNAKGQITAEIKVYKDDTYEDVEKIYQLAYEIIDRLKKRCGNKDD